MLGILPLGWLKTGGNNNKVGREGWRWGKIVIKIII